MIVVVGEALVDLVRRVDGSISAHPGGGPFNTARTLGRLGRPVTFLGRLSNDAFGRQLRAELTADGVGDATAPDTDDPTTLALAQLDEGGAATYHFYVQGTSVPGLTPDDALTLVPAQVDALHVGTLGLVLEPFAVAAEALVDRLAGSALVLVDPNVRPILITDRASYLARLERIVAKADVLKVSDEDLAWLAPGVEPITAARRLLDQGAGLVLVTLGANGATAVGPGFAEHVDAPAVDVIDTIGAGDSFAGAVLAWWEEHDRPSLADATTARAAVAFAVRVAAITCSRAGANPPWRYELD